jgi:murein DD-endopeptidase MepM/ murein hydrolase activator NlpD
VQQSSAETPRPFATTAPAGGRARRAVLLGAALAAACAAGGIAWYLARPVAAPVAVPVEAVATPGPVDRVASAASAALKPLGKAVEVIVHRHDTLDAIFRRLSVSVEDLAAIRNLPGVRQSLDMLKPGDVISLTSLNGELTSINRRVSETATLSVRREAGGEFAANIVHNVLDVRTSSLRGRISSSLFRSFNDLGASDQVALQLAEVFRYDIDFAQELQPGDTFAVVLEQIWRDGKFLRDGDILAAEFVNSGHAYRAVRYTLPDGRHEYYTPDGKSIRKAFLLAPVQFSRISSGFGLRWHPILDRMGAHKGIDYAAPVGTPIRAAGDGRLSFRGTQRGYGNVIVLGHAGGVETLYGHMSGFAPNLYVGRRVKQGDVIGFVGMTGLATGPHLHYEYRVGGVHRNPASIKALPAEPIPTELRTDFDTRSRGLLAGLAPPAAVAAPVATAPPAAPSAAPTGPRTAPPVIATR